MVSAARRIGGFLALVLLFTLIALFPQIHGEEAWYLQVVDRLRGGAILYRDVFLGATPLSAWIAAALARWFGAEILLLRMLSAAALAVSVYMLTLVYRRVARLAARQVPTNEVVLFALACLALFPAPIDGVGCLYTPFAYMGLAWSCLATLRVLECGSLRRGLMLGAAVSFTFAVKHNIGVYALTAAALCCVLNHRAISRAAAAAACGVCLGCGALLGAVLYRQGALYPFLEQTVLNKGLYLERASLSPARGFLDALFFYSQTPDLRGVQRMVLSLDYPLSLAAAGAAGWGAVRVVRESRYGLLVPHLFFAAALAGVLPRADLGHLMFLGPWSVLMLFHLQAGTVKRGVHTCVGVLALACLILFLGVPLRQGARGEFSRLDYPHFRHLPLAAPAISSLTDTRALLRANFTPGEAVFFMAGADSSFYYLLGGLRNPTKYDYPFTTPFGVHGQEEVIELLRAGKVSKICYRFGTPGPFVPVVLSEYVTKALHAQKDIGVCRVYEPASRE